jgi:hypothetical protein
MFYLPNLPEGVVPMVSSVKTKEEQKQFVGFYFGKRCVVMASSSLDAKNKCLEHWKVPKSKAHMVSVVLSDTEINCGSF